MDMLMRRAVRVHMPRWASRITLEVVRVRVQHLHDITEDVARWGAPAMCPTGLFGRSITALRLAENQSHQSDKWGHTGMVYWQPFVHLLLIAPLAEVMPEFVKVRTTHA